MNICIGCGVCEQICPHNAINIKWIYGEYYAYLDRDKCIKCGMCNKVCPFDVNNIYEISRDNMLGSVKNCYIGEAPQFRKNSTSGGALTELCKYLLENRLVDSIICVSPGERQQYFEYAEVSDMESLMKCSRSAYYPVSLTSIKETLKKNSNKKFAVVGTPCVCNGLNNLRKVNTQYAHSIKYILGIVCSYSPNAEMISHIARNVNIRSQNIKSISFREKSVGDLYGLCIQTQNGEVKKYRPQEWGLNSTFLSKDYIRKACLVCNDVYALLADVVFMDAWKKGEKDTLGTSLVITRNSDIDTYIQNMNWKYEVVHSSCAVVAQDYGHLIDFKIEGSRYRRNKLGYLSAYNGVKMKEKIESIRLIKANKILENHLKKQTTFDRYRKDLKVKTIFWIYARKICSFINRMARER